MWTFLIEESEENFEKVIAGLLKLEDGATAELTPQDFRDNVMVKIGDEVKVDVSTRAWTVSFAEANANALEITVDGVRVPYLSVPDLIRSKQTYCAEDQADVERLRKLLLG